MRKFLVIRLLHLWKMKNSILCSWISLKLLSKLNYTIKINDRNTFEEDVKGMNDACKAIVESLVPLSQLEEFHIHIFDVHQSSHLI